MANSVREAITTIENAGKYLVESRKLHQFCDLDVTDAARANNPDVQALALLSVVLAAICGVIDDGWVEKAKSALGLENHHA